jgi:hypothetical protein
MVNKRNWPVLYSNARSKLFSEYKDLSVTLVAAKNCACYFDLKMNISLDYTGASRIISLRDKLRGIFTSQRAINHAEVSFLRICFDKLIAMIMRISPVTARRTLKSRDYHAARQFHIALRPKATSRAKTGVVGV